MRIETTVLGKLRFIGGLQPRLHVPRLTFVHVGVRRLSLIGGRDWAVPEGARDFRREQLARQAQNESMGRPIIMR
jgi:hypothetical protein